MDGWEFKLTTTGDVRALWEDMADDVREEFAKQGITDFSKFIEDVSSGDRAMTLFYRGEIAAMMWSGYIDDKCRMRSLGCVVSKKAGDVHRFAVGRGARGLLDEYLADEPDRNHGVFVAIPTTSERLNKFATRLAGLRVTGINHVLGVPHFIYRWEGGDA